MQADVAQLRAEDVAIRADLGNEIRAVATGLGAFRTEVRRDLEATNVRIDALATKIDAQRADLAKDLKLQSMQQTIATGLTVYSAIALLFAALKLFP